MKNLLEYNGYYAKIEYSDEDSCFFGTFVDINDSISFEGQNIKELKAAFVEAVEDYLDMCKRIGKEPEKSYKGSFNVRIDPELHKKAVLLAASKGVSLNSVIETAIENEVLKKAQ